MISWSGSAHQPRRRDVEAGETDAGCTGVRRGPERVPHPDVAGRRDVGCHVPHQVPPEPDDAVLPFGPLPVVERDLAEDRRRAGDAPQAPSTLTYRPSSTS